MVAKPGVGNWEWGMEPRESRMENREWEERWRRVSVHACEISITATRLQTKRKTCTFHSLFSIPDSRQSQ